MSNKHAPAPTLGELEQLVLLALLHLGDDAYGVSVQDELKQRAGRRTTLGTVYTTLGRLEDKGYVTTRLGEPTPARGGRRKKHYQVTAAGRTAVQRSLAALKRMAGGLDTALARP
jgi:PadR family transcriptional regulator PadR